MIALYPIKPTYIDKILDGSKKYELRRRIPSNPIAYIFLYSTFPVGKVVGYAKVKKMHSGNVSHIWKKYRSHLGIRKDDYDSYFVNTDLAYAIEFSEVSRFARPFSITEIDPDMVVPQSFCYLGPAVFVRLKRRKAEVVWKDE